MQLPASYALYLLSLMHERGHATTDVLSGTALTEAELGTHNKRIEGQQYGRMLANALRISNDPALAYELGLRSQLTQHGFVGFGLMSSSTLEEAVALGQRYLQARAPLFNSHIHYQNDWVIVELVETISLGVLKSFTCDIVLVELCCLFNRLLSGQPTPSHWRSEICVPYPEPAHYAAWQTRLPKFHFSQPSMQIRFPAQLLTQRIATANPVTAQLAIAQCEQELAELAAADATDPWVAQALALLTTKHGQYDRLSELAGKMHLSERTLKRRLQDAGTSYQRLLDQARQRHAEIMLAQPEASIAKIAAALGYQDPANFTRAFRQWTGLSPTAYRRQQFSPA
mgnify:FL=1